MEFLDSEFLADFQRMECSFLKKLLCYVGGDVKHENLDLSTELIREIVHRKEIESFALTKG